MSLALNPGSWSVAPSGLIVPRRHNPIATGAALDRARRFRAWFSQLYATARRRQHNSSTRRAIHNTATRRAIHNKSSDSACGCGCGKCYCPLCSTDGSTTKCWFNVDASDIDWQLCDNQCVGGLSASFFFQLTDFNAFECDIIPLRIKTTTSVTDPNGSFDHAGGGGLMFSEPSATCIERPMCNWGRVGNFTNVGGLVFGSSYGPDGPIYLDGSTASCSTAFNTDNRTPVQPYWSWVLHKTDEKWYLAYAADLGFVSSDPDNAGRSSGLGIILYKFYGTLDATDADDCGQTLTIDNELPGCGPFNGVFDADSQVSCGCTAVGVSLASGGTAVVTWTDSPP